MNESHLISKGWLKKTPLHDDTAYLFYLPGEEKSKYYGRALKDALAVQDVWDTLDVKGIHWKIAKQRNGFGFKVMYLLKGTTCYRMFTIVKEQTEAEKCIDRCKMNFSASDFIDCDFKWIDESQVEKMVLVKNHYDDQFYLVKTYTDYVKICFRFLETYYTKRFDMPAKPIKPSFELDSVPEELKQQAEQKWSQYHADSKVYDRAFNKFQYFTKILKDWEKDENWFRYHADVLNGVADVFQDDIRVEDFNDPNHISEILY